MAAKRRRIPMHSDDLSLHQLISAYQLYNKAVGKSATTIAWYDNRLAMFATFLGPEPQLGDLDVAHMRAYIVHLQERRDRHVNNPYMHSKEGSLSSAYVHGCVRAVRAFASWLYTEGHTETNRLQAVKPPKVQKKVIPVLHDDEVRRLVSQFNRDDPFGARNFALIWTLLDCGLRASELCNLRTADVHLREGYLKVLGKGNKERLVPLGAGAQAALVHWRDRVRALFAVRDEPYLFLNANGERLSLNAVEEVVKRAGVHAGIPRITCHLLRHSFATNYLSREVGDPFRLQQILGHTSLEMVRHYVAAASIQQSLIERRASPMDLITAGAPANLRRLQPRRGTTRLPGH